MKDARSATRTIWKTVVFAGAMLAAPACSKNNGASTTPDNSGGAEVTDPCAGTTDPCAGTEDPCAGTEDPCAGVTDDPCAGWEDPCAGRPRGGDDEGGVGRGFVLS